MKKRQHYCEDVYYVPRVFKEFFSPLLLECCKQADDVIEDGDDKDALTAKNNPVVEGADPEESDDVYPVLGNNPPSNELRTEGDNSEVVDLHGSDKIGRAQSP